MTGTNYRVVLAVALLVGVVVYGGLTGVQSAIDGDLPNAPTANDVTASDTTMHLDRTGRPTVVGVVENGLSRTVSNVTVTVTFYRDGEVVSNVTADALRSTVPSGESAPFDVHMAGEGRADDYAVSVSYDEGGEVVDGLAVVDSAVADRAQDQVDVTATVKNTAGRPLVVGRVVGTFYDANGSAIGARTIRPARRLAPGATVTVRLSFRTLGDVPSYAQEFDHFEVAVVAERPEAD